ncbi:MAG: AIR synthase-related protein [Syntrophales bacterium]|nr:AIR synthase-related protein [Syntrophales bacterium]
MGSGCLGSCAAAVVGLKEGVKNQKWRSWAKRVLSLPSVPIEKSLALSDLRLGHGGIDISDGLGVSIHNLCDQSNTGAVIYADQIPVATPVLRIAMEKGISPWSFSFASGGDFQFLATTSPRAEAKLHELGFHLIGRITKSRTRSIHIAHRGEHALPSIGHRDSRQLSFYEEVLRLAWEVDHV